MILVVGLVAFAFLSLVWLYAQVKLGLIHRLVSSAALAALVIVFCSGNWYQQVLNDRFAIQKAEIDFIESLVTATEQSTQRSVLRRLQRLRRSMRVSYEIRNNLDGSSLGKSSLGAVPDLGFQPKPTDEDKTNEAIE
ncbi:hypothetical protein SV7mr_06100 [Stieleria bergensis]|uniref:Uncharacterized protein n=1 Tax=Stieleria bergensis TaxID=2528025 RepID=A0A517SPS3_9BACT|nr:hypothetical protein SV7mr_06100 [Planctomycetes bacterium SV_7m_r]